ncbi:hypothetical protein RJD24_01245 [Bacillaceae bacterium IKA-2]|nr:hypothetical protein RJD24_01245 [Bacillaceae bacterium IKA-2]
MAYIVSLLIVGLCLYLVITPLLKPKVATKKVDEDVGFEEISLPNVYATLNELEMDYNMQKLNDEDYSKLKNEYEKLAAELIAKEEQDEAKAKTKTKTSISSNRDQTQDQDIEAEIEAELAKLREERGERK